MIDAGIYSRVTPIAVAPGGTFIGPISRIRPISRITYMFGHAAVLARVHPISPK